jgi:hypothetical protein
VSTEAKFWAGMVASILVAIAGQAEVLPEPWRHYASIGGIVGTAVTGYMLQSPRQIEPPK